LHLSIPKPVATRIIYAAQTSNVILTCTLTIPPGT